MLHVATLLALLVYFRADWLRLVPAGLRDHPRPLVPRRPDRRLAWLLAVATVPAVIAGVLLNDLIETTFREPGLVARHARRRGGDPVARGPLGLRRTKGVEDVDVPDRPRHRRRPGARARSRASAAPASRSRRGCSPAWTARRAARFASSWRRRSRPAPGSTRSASSSAGEAGVDVGRCRCRRGSSRRSSPACSRSASCCATSGRSRSGIFVVYRLVLAAVVVVVWLDRRLEARRWRS